jgi:hypothetical protein
MFEPDLIIIQADIHILDIHPAISRRFELPGDLNLAQLHEVIQASFEWTDSHLHQFEIGGLTFGAPEFDEGDWSDWSDRRTFEASEVRLCDFAAHGPAPLIIFYEYDFGDSWMHVIELLRKAGEPGTKYPRCVGGSRRAPPEDVGGPSGYFDFLEAWHDPRHKQHKAMRRWAGRAFHPELFDLDANNKAIAKALKRSKGNYRFRLYR